MGTITLFKNTEVSVYGKEIRMHRYHQNLSLAKVSERMNEKGWYYYPCKLFRMESKKTFSLSGSEMMDLLECIEAQFQIK